MRRLIIADKLGTLQLPLRQSYTVINQSKNEIRVKTRARSPKLVLVAFPWICPTLVGVLVSVWSCWSISKGLRSWHGNALWWLKTAATQKTLLCYYRAVEQELIAEHGRAWKVPYHPQFSHRLSASVPLPYNASSIYGTPHYKKDHLRRIEHNEHPPCSLYRTILTSPLPCAWQGTITQGWYIAISEWTLIKFWSPNLKRIKELKTHQISKSKN